MPPRVSFLAHVALCSLLWGSAFPLIKIAYASWPSRPMLLCLFFAGVRFTLAGGAILAFTRELGEKLSRVRWRLLFLLALSQTFLQYCFFYTGMAVSSGVLGALLTGCGSLWWILLAPVLLKTPKPQRREWTVLAISAVGVSIAVYAPGAGAGNVWLGSICFLGSSLTGALALIIMRPLSLTVDARTATGCALFAGGVVLLLVGAPSAPLFMRLLTWEMALITMILAAVSAVSFSIWNRLAHEHSVNQLASYRFLIPLSGVLQSSILAPGESLGLGTIVGGFMVFAALASLEKRSVLGWGSSSVKRASL